MREKEAEIVPEEPDGVIDAEEPTAEEIIAEKKKARERYLRMQSNLSFWGLFAVGIVVLCTPFVDRYIFKARAITTPALIALPPHNERAALPEVIEREDGKHVVDRQIGCTTVIPASWSVQPLTQNGYNTRWIAETPKAQYAGRWHDAEHFTSEEIDAIYRDWWLAHKNFTGTPHVFGHEGHAYTRIELNERIGIYSIRLFPEKGVMVVTCNADPLVNANDVAADMHAIFASVRWEW